MTQDHTAMMADPDRWPNYPILPLRRPSSDTPHYPYECGILIDLPTTQHTVFHTNMFMLPSGLVSANTMMQRYQYTVYASYDDITADGWTVD